MKEAKKMIAGLVLKVLVIGILVGLIGGIIFHKYGVPVIEPELKNTIHEIRMDYDAEYAVDYYEHHPIEYIKTKF